MVQIYNLYPGIEKDEFYFEYFVIRLCFVSIFKKGHNSCRYNVYCNLESCHVMKKIFLYFEVFKYVKMKYVGKFFYWTYKQKETDVSY